MKVTIGKEGLSRDCTWQDPFQETTKCCYCGKMASIGFVAHEGLNGEVAGDIEQIISELHTNEAREEQFWLHGCCAVAVYFCRSCLEPTALYNQA